jgi:hypothetical protein
MVVRSWVGRASAAWVLVCLLACTTGPSFIELIDERTGESMQFLVPRVGSQAAGPDEIGDLAGNMTDVRHNLTRRYAAFMLDGDVVYDPQWPFDPDFTGMAGSPAHGLLLPPADSTDEPIGVDIRAFDPMKWSSFRTYDRGECSTVVGWEALTAELADEVIQEIGRDPLVNSPAFREARLRPTLQSRPLAELEGIAVMNTDRLSMEIDFHALDIGPCLDVTASLAFSVQLEPTPLAIFQVPAIAFWKACTDGELLRDERFLNVDEAIDLVCDGDSQCANGNDDDYVAFLDTLAQGGLPECEARDDAFGIGSVAGIPMANFEDIRLLSRLGDVSVDREREVLFVGYSRVAAEHLPFGTENRAFEARDAFFRVVDVEVTNVSGSHRWSSWRLNPHRRCGSGARNAIASAIRRGLRRGLPGGLADAINDMLMLDPYLATDGVPEVDEVSCNLRTVEEGQPDQCSFRFAGVPAYEAPGFWRGARHKCMMRDSSEGAVGLIGGSAAIAVDAQPEVPVCHVRLEPRAMHVRPDGLEIVFITNGSSDPQGAFFQEGGLIREFSSLCDSGRDPVIDDDDRDPLFVGPEDGVFVVSGDG